MNNSSATISRPGKVLNAWSTKARSGSPQPMIKTGEIRSTKMPKYNNNTKTQNDLLCGIGSQFPTIDDSIKNKDIHPNL
ncbi:hypothetical protein GGI35DRAFT_474390 [Trichoderma velutinum]